MQDQLVTCGDDQAIASWDLHASFALGGRAGFTTTATLTLLIEKELALLGPRHEGTPRAGSRHPPQTR